MCGYLGGPTDNKKMAEREKQYRAEDDHRTMSRVAEIEGDPERMKYVREHHRKKTGELARMSKRMGSGRKVAQRA